jgi:REP element-mobilizing transposase RayT
LVDSFPKERLDAWRDELAHLSEKEASAERRRRIETYLDAGFGRAWLREVHIAELVQNSLLHFDGERYYLHAWVIMPNHVHVLLTPCTGWSLSEILHSWKSYTAKEANHILGRTGNFWEEEYFDRFIRNEQHFIATVDYIESNPVKAGLCIRNEEWEFGSAAQRWASTMLTPPETAGETPALPGRRNFQ